MPQKKKRSPSRGEKHVSPAKKYAILKMRLEGQTPKRISYETKINISSVYIALKEFPLFFWKKDPES